MKKVMMILLSIMMIVNVTVVAEASDFSTGLSGGSSIDKGATFTVDITVNSSKELYGVSGGLSYDSSKLELVSSEGKNGFALTIGTSVVADTASPKKGSFTVGTLRFKAKSSLDEGDSTKISFSGVEGSDGASTLSGGGASRTVSVKVPPKAPEPKPAPTPKSSNNNLSSLSVSPGSISFSKNTTSYHMTVDHDVDTINVRAAAEDSKARVSGTGNKNLSVYENRVNVTVTAENGSQKTYTINVTRRDERGSTEPLSGNANLSKLEVEGYPLEFSSDTKEYEMDVNNHIPAVVVNASPDHSEASVEIENPEELALGENEITITVTAENGEKKTYRITVNRGDTASEITMEELEEAIRNSTVKEVILRQDEGGIISEEILQLLKDEEKTLIVRALDKDEAEILYEWVIDGEGLEDLAAVQTLLAFDCENREEIIESANFARGLILSFDHNEVLPAGTKVRINVGEHYSEGTELNLYYYEEPAFDVEELSEEELEELSQEDMTQEPFETRGRYLVDEDGFVTLSLDHTSQYFLTRATLVEETQDQGNTSRSSDHNIFIYLSGLQFLAIIGLVVYKLQLRRKQK